MLPWIPPPHMPCEVCGASVHRDERDEHECDPERKLDYEMFQLRGEIAEFDQSLEEYLLSPQGRFATWSVEQERKQI